MGTRKEHERIISIDPRGQSITWRSSRGGDGTDKDFPINDILDIYEGARTKVLESLRSNASRASCCFSVIGEQKTVDFEAQSPEEKNRWVDNLRIIVNVSK